MWRVTAEGRRLLKEHAQKVGGRQALSRELRIGKNQIKELLDSPDHSICKRTHDKLCAFAPEMESESYLSPVDVNEGCEVRLARDRDPRKELTHHDKKGIERLYEALLKNPEFRSLRSTLDSLSEFRHWLNVWGSTSEDMPSEQIFVYRTYQDQVISFLFGERHLRKTLRDTEVLAIWNLVGTANAFYDDSPVGLDDEAARNLPVGERESAARLAIRLLEELREIRSVSYLVFEIEASELRKPDSYSRLLFRVYAHAELEVRAHFKDDALLKDSQFFVLDFPFLVPRDGKNEGEVTLLEHRLVCCPMKPDLLRPFKSGTVPTQTVERLAAAIYEMYWDYYDADSPTRAVIQAATLRAQEIYRAQYGTHAGIPCFTLAEFIKRGFGSVAS